MPAIATRSVRQGRLVRPCLFFGLALALLAAPVQAASAARPAAGRIMAPARVSCDPNQLTAYFGHVVGYRRSAKQTWLRIATDYGTTEEVTLEHGGATDGSAHFLLRGEPFRKKDWALIESKPGVLRKGTRATAWVCGDGKTAPLIDWNGAAE